MKIKNKKPSPQPSPLIGEGVATNGFTLVELIVVITILAILSTIGFVSYSSYLAGTRDGNRIAQLKAISEGLHLYGTNHSLPTPDTTSTSIMDGLTQIATQGYAGKNVLETITYSTEGVDPKDKTYFSYYLTQDKKYFQLMAFLEEEDNLQNTAIGIDYTTRYPTVYGDKLGILTTGTNEPIQISTGSIDISNLGTTELKSYLKDGEYVSGSGIIFLNLDDVDEKGGRFWKVIDNRFVYSDPNAQWRELDTNCDIDDIIIGSQTWAGCNSTLGTGVEYNDNNNCYAYSATNNGGTACYGYNTKENAYDSINGINNIWGKLYLWDDSESACAYGWHVPSDEEWTTLENTLFGSTCAGSTFDRDSNLTADGDGWGCEGLGWAGHTSKNSSNNMIEALQLPLAGFVSSSIFYYRGFGTYLWSSDTNGSDAARGRYLFRDYSTVSRNSRLKAYGYSVRCIKD